FGAAASRECKQQGKQHDRRQRRENPIDTPAQRRIHGRLCSQSRKTLRRRRSLSERLANACLPAPRLSRLFESSEIDAGSLDKEISERHGRVHEWMLGDHFGGTHQAAKEGGLRNSTSE